MKCLGRRKDIGIIVITRDEMAGAETVGAILLFGLFVAVITILNVTSVPAAGLAAEEQHHEDVLAALGDERPVVVLVDDLHWVDPSSQRVLLFVARRLSSERVALALGSREDHRALDPLGLD